MPFIESFEEFKQRQNCEVVQIQQTDFQDAWQFENGAACIQQKVGNGTLEVREPPREKFALLRAKRLFVEAKLGRKSRDFRAALGNHKQQAIWAAQYPHACPSVPAGAMDSLRATWDSIEKLKADLKQLDQQLADSPEGILARQRREVDQRDADIRADRQRTAYQFSGISPTGGPPKRDIVEEVGEYFQSNQNLNPKIVSRNKSCTTT